MHDIIILCDRVIITMEYGATGWNPYQKYTCDMVERVQHRTVRFVKSRYTRYSIVFCDMLDELGWPPAFSMETRLIWFYKIKAL